MAKITVFSLNEDLDYINNQSIISFRKEEDELDKYRIVASYNGTDIGFVAASMMQAVPGTTLNKEIFEEVPDVFQGQVIDNTKTVNNTSTNKVLVVEINIATSASSAPTSGSTMFTFSVNGSSSKYAGKNEVIQDASNGRKVFLQLKKTNDNKGNVLIVLTRTINGVDMACGKIDTSKCGQNSYSSIEEYDLISEILDSEALECKVSQTLPTAYVVQLEMANSTIDQYKNAADNKIIGSVKQNLVAQGWDESDLIEIEDYLKANGFSSTEIQNIFKTYKQYPNEIKFRIKKPKTWFKDNFESLKICYAAFLNGYHLLLSGDKGTGKNSLIATWAWVLQRPLYEIAINRETDKLDLLGSNIIGAEVDSNSGAIINSIEFSPEVLLEAMEVGGIINIDEINFAEPGITGLLHSIGDDRRAIQVPGYKYVAADENFFIMATMNLDYQGTNELNEALADRFVDIKFPSNTSIANILFSNCPRSPQTEIQMCDAIYKEMYKIISNRDSSLDSNCLTVRGFIQALSMSPILGLKKALEICVADKIKDEEYSQNVKTIIDNKVK